MLSENMDLISAVVKMHEKKDSLRVNHTKVA